MATPEKPVDLQEAQHAFELFVPIWEHARGSRELPISDMKLGNEYEETFTEYGRCWQALLQNEQVANLLVQVPGYSHNGVLRLTTSPLNDYGAVSQPSLLLTLPAYEQQGVVLHYSVKGYDYWPSSKKSLEDTQTEFHDAVAAKYPTIQRDTWTIVTTPVRQSNKVQIEASRAFRADDLAQDPYLLARFVRGVTYLFSAVQYEAYGKLFGTAETGRIQPLVKGVQHINADMRSLLRKTFGDNFI